DLGVAAVAAARGAHVVARVTAGAVAMSLVIDTEHALRVVAAGAAGGLRAREAVRHVAAGARVVAGGQRAWSDRGLRGRMARRAAPVSGAGGLVRRVAVETSRRAGRGRRRVGRDDG